ncbi:NTP transferase domain-containing protein [Micromonospora sp. NPDC023956]|uniref:molybdenum cofactor guanylyltransferase n=1 Tax=Micromonospora sp. NPDC023956 TaxID=3155722 RepID=UPI0033E3FB5B
MSGYAAVVLTGGAARRLGGVDKPGLPIGGRPMRDRVLAAVADATPRIVVGPGTVPVPAGVRLTREEPAGGGPVAAVAAGLALLPPDTTTVALLAGDLPLLTATAVGELRRALAADPGADGVCPIDADGRRQSLCGLWRAAPLRTAVDRLTVDRGGTLAGASVRALLTGLTVAELRWSGAGPPPWFDCDTDDDVRRAEEWTR